MSFSEPSYTIVRRPTRINLGLCMAQNEFRQMPNSKNPSIIGRAKKLVKKDSDVSEDDMVLGVSLNESKPSLDWNVDDKDCDTDLEDEGSKENIHYGDEQCRMIYLKACKRYGVIPSKGVVADLTSSSMKLNHQSLGPRDINALAVGLVINSTITELSLRGNDIGIEGLLVVEDLLKENVSISSLDISDNNLGSKAAKIICRMVTENARITSLSVSGNQFVDNDAYTFAKMIVDVYALEELDLSHNEFREQGGLYIGAALAENTSLQKLSLRWNHLRLDGALAITNGVKVNNGLKVLDISMNGLGDSGAAAMGEALKENRTLLELNMRNNRITINGVKQLFEGIVGNDALRTIKICNNPIMAAGVLEALKSLRDSHKCALETIEVTDCHITKECEDLIRIITKEKPKLVIKHGGTLTGEDTGALLRDSVKAQLGDPITILINFVKENNLRMMDLFARMDSDGSYSISREEFICGIKDAEIPLSNYQLDVLINDLDTDNDGEIDFGELMTGHLQYRRRRRRQLHKQQEQSRRCSTGVSAFVTPFQSKTPSRELSQPMSSGITTPSNTSPHLTGKSSPSNRS